MTEGAVKGQPAELSEGLRERKKRLMRQLISDTATGMFLEHGFDEVRIADVAAACDVSEKTVYNYFPTKESLLLDREETMATAIRRALGPGSPSRSPIEAAVAVITADLEEMRGFPDTTIPSGFSLIPRFRELIETTPSLRAAQQDMMNRLASVAAEAMAERVGVSPDDPEPQIAATAILGLWRIQFQSLGRYADGTRTPDAVFAKVSDDVRRAARLIDSGLWAFSVMAQGAGSREQLKTAAEAAQHAGRQVATAMKQARAAWRQIQVNGHPGGGGSREWGRPPHRGDQQDRQAFQREMQELRRQAQRDAQEPRRQAQSEMRERLHQAQREMHERIQQARREQQEAARGARGTHPSARPPPHGEGPADDGAG